MTNLVPLVIIILLAVSILLGSRRLAQREGPALRPLAGYTALKGQVGRAIESASQLHISLGRASLTGAASTTRDNPGDRAGRGPRAPEFEAGSCRQALIPWSPSFWAICMPTTTASWPI